MILLYVEGSGSKFQSVNTKTSQFSHFFGFQELRKHMSTPKLVNFPHFLIPGVEKETCQHKNESIFPNFSDSRSYIYIYINMYICTYVYYMILLYLESSGSKFHSVNTKTSQFSPFFGFQELRTNRYIYNIYVYMYICILHDFAIFGG